MQSSPIPPEAPQAKKESCKLKRYLQCQKRIAQVGPPPTQTTTMLQSLLDGKKRKTVNHRRNSKHQKKKNTVETRERGSIRGHATSGNSDNFGIGSKKDDMWANVNLAGSKQNSSSTNVFSGGNLDDLIPSIPSSSLSSLSSTKIVPSTKCVAKKKSMKAKPLSTSKDNRTKLAPSRTCKEVLESLTKHPSTDMTKNMLSQTSRGQNHFKAKSSSLQQKLPLNKSIFTSSLVKKKSRPENRFIQGPSDKQGCNNSRMVSSSSTSSSDSSQSLNLNRISELSSTHQLPPIQAINETVSPKLTTLPPFNNIKSTAQTLTHKTLSNSSLLPSQPPSLSQLPTINSIKNNNNTKKRKAANNNDNFIRLNLRNKAGSCKGARNIKNHNRQKRWRARNNEINGNLNHNRDSGMADEKGVNPSFSSAPTRKQWKPKNTINDAIDPIDDFLDGTFRKKSETNPPEQKSNPPTEKRQRTSDHPLCTRHNRQCKLLTVKKNTSGNKGRKFFACSLPRGEQCDFFQWEDDTIESTRNVLLEESSNSGFIARQVAGHIDRFKTLTVPELRLVAKQKKLNSSGIKKQLIARLSVWVRDEICTDGHDLDDMKNTSAIVERDDANKSNDSGESDDDSNDSTSSDELEFFEIEGENSSGAESETNKKNCDEDVNPNGLKSPLHQSLFDLFGYSEFRDGQEWAIRRCLAHERTLLVAPTGMGKSLCYALPAALMDGVCIVISPLVSLIEDQLRHLPPRIPSATLSGNISKKKMALILDDLLQGRLKILFISPEKLTSAAFRRLLRPKYNVESKKYQRQLPPVSLLCLDEAHCLSQWGHNFRSSYLRIRAMMNALDPRSILALTATAGPPVIDDICHTLRISNLSHESDKSAETSVKVLNCNRDNIHVSAIFLQDEDRRLRMLLKLLQKPAERLDQNTTTTDTSLDSDSPDQDEMEGSLSKGSVIVYVWRKKDAEVVTEQIQASGVAGGVVCYHGGMDASARSKAQGKFMRGKARVCVATVAFGLGINKTDVKGVIHLCLPSSPENYLQEIGRAGRDGTKAKAVAIVIENEIAQKHSLSFSNKISFSQVETCLNIMQDLTKEAVKDSSNGLSDVETINLNVVFPIMPMIQSVDLKEETIFTILSILEDDTPHSPKMLDIQGIIPDFATVTLKRRSIEDLASTEPVGRCILECGTKIDARSGNSSSLSGGGTAMQHGFAAYSFGSVEFSVVQCSRLLGPRAEPRNVYAALRRLQNMGELELSFNDTGRSIFLKMNEEGLNFFNETNPDNSRSCRLKDLTNSVCNYFSELDMNQCSKVLEMQHILRQISPINEKEESISLFNSKRQELFQKMVKRYFIESSNEKLTEKEKTLRFEGKILEIDENDATTLRFLSSDVATLQTISFSNSCSLFPSYVQFGNNKYSDYTALLITKILHGIPSPSTPSLNWYSHPLWGKWRPYDFNCLHGHIRKILGLLEAQINKF